MYKICKPSYLNQFQLQYFHQGDQDTLSLQENQHRKSNDNKMFAQ